MCKNAKKSKRAVFMALSLLLILGLVLLPMIGQSRAKYRTQTLIANEVDYQHTLAESFMLLDRPVVLQEDGSYLRAENAEPTSGFTYKLIPGITIPASPYIEIKGKTEIPAYLYMEIVSPEGGPTLTIASDWQRLDGVSGKKGGEVFVYQNGTALVGSGEDDERSIDVFTVQTLDPLPMELESGEIQVFAYMIQAEENMEAEEAFEEAPPIAQGQEG